MIIIIIIRIILMMIPRILNPIMIGIENTE